MTELVLVRHGETVWHAENRYAGSSDVPLSDLGTAQALRLAEWARDAGLTALWCSPATRAVLTAEPVAETTGLVPEVDPRLRELDFGKGEGRTVEEMAREFPSALDAFRRDPVAGHLPGGEHPQAAVDRALDCFRDIAAAEPAGRVLIVAHTTLLRLVLCHLLGIPLRDYRRVFPYLRNTGLTVVRFERGGGALLEFNSPVPSAK
ncbi:MAG: histidine phosphatase family protein [Streptosporangiales bacterium]|nr:histidine phosphatase family protein [Streptosporangiales bacterium]MBO0890254.1 histidine phosphatase family protein [Acidothermales bacterium]